MNENQNVVVRRRRGPAEIEQLVVEFTQSGMNPREFCVGRGLSLSTLQRYRNKQGQKRGGTNSEGRLVPVELASRPWRSECGRGWAVVLGSGRKIEVPDDFEEATLERLVGVLERV